MTFTIIIIAVCVVLFVYSIRWEMHSMDALIEEDRRKTKHFRLKLAGLLREEPPGAKKLRAEYRLTLPQDRPKSKRGRRPNRRRKAQKLRAAKHRNSRYHVLVHGDENVR